MTFRSSLAISLLTLGIAHACTGPRTVGELRAQMLEGYDKFSRPGIAQAVEQDALSGEALQMITPPETARVQLHVISLNGVDQKTNRYDMSVWLRRSWVDYRLAYDTVSKGGCFPDDGRQGFHEDILKDIWAPDFYVDNQSRPASTVAESVWIYPDGRVLWVAQLELILDCNMEFKDFPYDLQKCGFHVGTFLEDASSVVLDYIEGMEPVTLGADQAGEDHHGGTNEWSIINAHPIIHSTQAGTLTEESKLEIEFELKRHTEYYTDFVIAPTILFVVIGWASFFINRAAAPARVGISITLFLTNTNFLASQLGQLPRLGNDVWLLRFLSMSQYFAFYAVIEYVICNYLRRIEARVAGARKKALENRDSPSETEKGVEQPLPENPTKEEILATGFSLRVDKMMLKKDGFMICRDEHVDIFSRFAYPVAYVIAYLVLWNSM